MTGEQDAARGPRSATDEERLSSRRAVSPRLALLERLNTLAGGIPGAAAYRAALWLLPDGPPSPTAPPPPGGRWDAENASWSVDHAAAMNLWSPRGGDGLPPVEMLDAFLADHVARTGDDGAREQVEQLYAEAVEEVAGPGRAPEAAPARTRAEVVAVADRYGYGDLVETISIDRSRGFGGALAFAVLPAVAGVVVLFRAGGDTLALVGGILLCALAAGILALGVVALRSPIPAAEQMFLFTGGVVHDTDGVLDPFAWPDLEVTTEVVVSTVGSDRHEVRETVLSIGLLARSVWFVVPQSYHRTVTDLATAGGAAFR